MLLNKFVQELEDLFLILIETGLSQLEFVHGSEYELLHFPPFLLRSFFDLLQPLNLAFLPAGFLCRKRGFHLEQRPLGEDLAPELGESLELVLPALDVFNGQSEVTAAAQGRMVLVGVHRFLGGVLMKDIFLFLTVSWLV